MIQRGHEHSMRDHFERAKKWLVSRPEAIGRGIRGRFPTPIVQAYSGYSLYSAIVPAMPLEERRAAEASAATLVRQGTVSPERVATELHKAGVSPDVAAFYMKPVLYRLSDYHLRLSQLHMHDALLASSPSRYQHHREQAEAHDRLHQRYHRDVLQLAQGGKHFRGSSSRDNFSFQEEYGVTPSTPLASSNPALSRSSIA